MFSCEFYEIYRNTFLQNTPGWLLLIIPLIPLLTIIDPQHLIFFTIYFFNYLNIVDKHL